VLVAAILPTPAPGDVRLIASYEGSLAGLEDFAVYRLREKDVSP
jgi:hypothetical protein